MGGEGGGEKFSLKSAFLFFQNPFFSKTQTRVLSRRFEKKEILASPLTRALKQIFLSRKFFLASRIGIFLLYQGEKANAGVFKF